MSATLYKYHSISEIARGG